MTTYRIFPSTAPPSAATPYSGGYIAGLLFQVTQSGMWFEGYWVPCCTTGQSTAPVKCCLWQLYLNGDAEAAGTLVPDTTVTSGTLTPGTYTYVPLETPVPISIGTPYTAAMAINGAFPFTESQFGPGDPFASGIVNGPLVCYSSSNDGATVNASPYNYAQGLFSVAGSDPTANPPLTGEDAFNSYADIQVSDTAPAAYAGTYMLFPNKFDASPTTTGDDADNFTLANQIDYSEPVELSWLWYFSRPGSAESLPTWAGVYSIATKSIVAQNASPSWVTPAGSPASAAGGRIKCAISGTLPAGQYKAAVYNSNGTSGTWSCTEYGYFLTGYGADGISWGPVSSPSNGDGTPTYIFQPNPDSTPPYTDGSSMEPANGTFADDDSVISGEVQYPYVEINFNKSEGAPPGAIAENFWVDLEVTPAPKTTTGYSLPLFTSGLT